MKATIAAGDWPRLLAWVEQALEVPAADREAWLMGVSLPAPLAEALRGLLDERRAIETEDFLAALPALPGVDAANPPHAQFAPGALIGPWRLLRELGQGGMSVVWLAVRADGDIDRKVALKLPHAGPGHELLAKRLLRERSILASLEHPHIARLYEVGMTDGGTPYLVMEHVQGDHLLVYADAHHLGITQRITLFQQVLRAVQYAHGKLVLHRDLKPGNILVTAGGEVKLLDFGIAKLMAGEGDVREQTELTRAADRRLTPSYASPEQLRGQTLGTASDVYSLGVILCELLCGQRPHASANGSAVQLEAAVLNQEPRAPSKRSPDAATLSARATSAGALAKVLRGDLDAIVLKALAKTPEQRYASAEALGADLGRWLVGAPVGAQAPGACYVLRKFVHRHRFSVALGTLVATALITATTVALLQSRSANQQADRRRQRGSPGCRPPSMNSTTAASTG